MWRYFVLKILVFWGVTLHRRVGFSEMSVDRDQLTHYNAPEDWILKNLIFFCFCILSGNSVSIQTSVSQAEFRKSKFGVLGWVMEYLHELFKIPRKNPNIPPNFSGILVRLFQSLVLAPSATKCVFVLWPVNVHILGFPGIRKIILRVLPWQKLSKLWSVIYSVSDTDTDWGVCSWPWQLLSVWGKADRSLFVASNRCISVTNTLGWRVVVFFFQMWPHSLFSVVFYVLRTLNKFTVGFS
jgi:hypothetical protein